MNQVMSDAEALTIIYDKDTTINAKRSGDLGS